MRLPDEGIQVLGIIRADESYVGTPTAHTFIRNGDTLILYGRAKHLSELEHRVKGDEGQDAHDARVEKHGQDMEAAETDDRSEQRAMGLAE